MITLEQVQFSYGKQPVIQDLTFAFAPGTFYGIYGPNGSGKSTLAQLISGELSPASGSIIQPWHTLRERADFLSVLTQGTPAKIPLSVREVIQMGQYRFAGNPAAPLSFSSPSQSFIDALELAPLLARNYNTLSGGEQQRVMLARVLAQETPIILLDEPENSLDLGFRHHAFHWLRHLAETGKCVIMISHDFWVAPQYLHQALLLDQGKLVAAGSPEQVLQASQLEKVFRYRTF